MIAIETTNDFSKASIHNGSAGWAGQLESEPGAVACQLTTRVAAEERDKAINVCHWPKNVESQMRSCLNIIRIVWTIIS